MRLILVSTCLAALALATPAAAQGAPDCDMLCRIGGYLAKDHMATALNEGAAVDAPTKAHRGHGGALHTKGGAAVAGRKPVAAMAATKPKAAKPEAAKPDAVAAAPAAARPVASPHRGVPAPVKSAPVEVAAAKPMRAAAVPAPVRTAVSAPHPRHARPAPAVARVAPPVQVAAAAPRVASRRLTASAFIPGSAPAMPAGFH